MTVMLKLAGDPVAVVRSRMPNKQLPQADEQSIVRDLRTKQQALIPAIEAQGGQVLATLQYAVNGIKVRATPDKIASFATLPGVVDVKPVRTYHLDNAESVPFIGAPLVWQGPPGLHGEHIKVAIIDTGIDYTHANFGGPGTPAAFATAFAHSTQPADPALFGPDAPKVKGGTDLVGDDYNASSSDPAKTVPHPDPNPLDCNGHGSHTAGTAAGFGVTSGGATFTGPYNAATPGLSFTIGPGVAPLADIYAVRVFGCSGSTNVVVEAIDWAIQHNMQVISMSLGASFGTEDDADAEASENAVKAGIVVVAASGNSGTGAYITSSPASGEKVISVAAMDSHQSFPGATLALTPSGSIVALDANGVTFSNGTSMAVVVLPDTKGTGIGGISLGCDPAEYTAAGVVGKLVVTARGTCARVARAIYGQMAGAAAVAMINNATGYPPYEGPITSNPDTGAPFNVTIPFLGVQGAASGLSADGAALKAATSATLSATTIANPTFRHFASFSSAGPRTGDGHLKPNVAAPGVSVFSTAMGTGNQGLFESGTSMATPHVAGSAALAIQAHPQWEADDVANAVVNTADANQLVGYSARFGGNGLVQPFPATRTSVTAEAVDGTPSLSFGIAEYTRDFKGEAELILRNHSTSPASFSVSVVKGPGAPHSVLLDSSVLVVPANNSTGLHVRLLVPAATTGGSNAFRQVQGRIVLTPTSGNNGTTLSVPYYLVARARSQVDAAVSGKLQGTNTSANVVVNNNSPLVAGSADFYAWGLSGNNIKLGSIGLRAVGVQSFNVGGATGELLVFAVNTFQPWNNASTLVFDILVLDENGVPVYDVEAADLGLFTTGSFSGQVAVAVFNLKTNAGVIRFLATAPTDGNTIELPLRASDIGVTSANPRFRYVAQSLDLFTGKGDAIASVAAFNAFNSSISTGAFASLAPGASATVPLTINPAEFALTPALGAMVVSLDNQTGQGQQALLLPVAH